MKIDKQFDKEFQKVEGLNKNWLPWIGNNYNSATNGNRFLVVGESNYLTPDDIDVNEKDYIRKLIEKDGTNEGEWWQKNNFISVRHNNLEKILSVNIKDVNEKRSFWHQSAYYNFIQSPLKSANKEDRPEYQLFLNGWEIFFQVINILEPRFCIMNGVESYNHFYEENAKKFGYSLFEKKEFEKIGDKFPAKPRKIILNKFDTDENITLLFIHHTSKIKPEFLEAWKKFVHTQVY